MKLNFGRRLVLFVHWLLSLVGCALAVTLFVWPSCMAAALALLERKGLVLKIYAIAVLLVYLIFAAGAVCIILGGKKRRERDAFIVVDSNETGHTRIATSAVDQMIRQAVRGVDGIAQMKASIINNDDSIDVAADVAIRSGVHVPTVTANIQRAIRGYIERNCGVTVRGVTVSVHSLTDTEEDARRGRRKKTRVSSGANQTPVENSAVMSGQADSGAKREADAFAEPLPEAVPSDEPEAIDEAMPEAAPVSAEEASSCELPDLDAPIALTLDPEPEVPAEDAAASAAEEVADEFVPEPVPESAPAAEETPAAQDAPAPKKRLFGRLFGKRGSQTPEEPAPVEPAIEPTPVEPEAAESEPVEPEADVAEELAAEEFAASEPVADEFASEFAPEEFDPWSAADEERDGQD